MTQQKQDKPPNKVLDNIVPIMAVVLLILGLVFAKGAVFALGPLLKFAIPGGVVYFGWRLVKKKFAEVAGNALRQKMDDAMRGAMGGPRGPQAGRGPAAGPASEPGDVIDLCPSCGAYLTRGHRCAPKKA